MKTLVVSMNLGSAPLHEHIAPFMAEANVAYQSVHDQAAARAWISEHHPRVVMLDSHVPLTSAPPEPRESRKESAVDPSLGGLVGANVNSLFAETQELGRWIQANNPGCTLIPVYSVSTGTVREVREEWGKIPCATEMFGYPLAKGNHKKLLKILTKLATPGG